MTDLDEQALRLLLHGVADAVPDRPSRDLAALHAGRHRRLQRRRGLLGASGLVAVLALSGAVLARPAAPLLPATLTCTADGARLAGDLVADPGGASFAVHNTTGEVVAVSVAAQTVYAPPGRTQVTVQVGVGPVAVSCGTDSALATTVRQPPGTELALGCDQPRLVSSALDPEVRHGGVVELTRDRLGGALPPDALLATDPDGPQEPVRQVRVTAGSQLLAVARWHAMPLPGEWHLESLQTCA